MAPTFSTSKESSLGTGTEKFPPCEQSFIVKGCGRRAEVTCFLVYLPCLNFQVGTMDKITWDKGKLKSEILANQNHGSQGSGWNFTYLPRLIFNMWTTTSIKDPCDLSKNKTTGGQKMTLNFYSMVFFLSHWLIFFLNVCNYQAYYSSKYHMTGGHCD